MKWFIIVYNHIDLRCLLKWHLFQPVTCTVDFIHIIQINRMDKICLKLDTLGEFATDVLWPSVLRDLSQHVTTVFELRE